MIVHHGVQIVGGAVVAVVGAVWITIAEHSNPSNLWEASPWIIIAAGASTIIVALWKDKKELAKQRLKDDKEREEKYRETINRLSDALERLSESDRKN